jgi:hypothetical protein
MVFEQDAEKGGWGSWDDPRARATRGLRRPSLDARSWDHQHPPLKNDSLLRPCLRNGASRRAGVGAGEKSGLFEHPARSKKALLFREKQGLLC